MLTIFAFILFFACIGGGFYILYLKDQIDQRNGYINRARKEIESLSRELKLIRANMRSENELN